MVAIILADGFEEIEAITPADVFCRGGVEAAFVSYEREIYVTGSHGVTIKTDGNIKKFKSVPNIDMVVLPGGMPGAMNLNNSENVKDLVRKVSNAGGYIAAICAAPWVPGSMGLLKGKNAACYPGFESKLEGAVISSDAVVRDGNIITARNAGAAMEWSMKLLEIMSSKAIADSVKSKINA